MRESLTPLAQSEGGGIVELRIPSKAEWVGVARLAVAGIASRLQFSIEDIEVEDSGGGVSVGELAPKRLGEPRVGGLGVFLIRSLMDDVEYELNPESGTKLTMTKFLRT